MLALTQNIFKKSKFFLMKILIKNKIPIKVIEISGIAGPVIKVIGNKYIKKREKILALNTICFHIYNKVFSIIH